MTPHWKIIPINETHKKARHGRPHATPRTRIGTETGAGKKMTVTFFDYAKNDIKKPFVCIFAYNINKFCISILRCSERGERASEKSTQKNEWLLHGTPITKYCIYRHPHHHPPPPLSPSPSSSL